MAGPSDLTRSGQGLHPRGLPALFIHPRNPHRVNPRERLARPPELALRRPPSATTHQRILPSRKGEGTENDLLPERLQYERDGAPHAEEARRVSPEDAPVVAARRDVVAQRGGRGLEVSHEVERLVDVDKAYVPE